MYYTFSASVVYALLNLVPSISGHACFIRAIGDSGGGVGKGLGVVDGTPRHNDKQIPFQADVAVFASPAVPWRMPYCKNKKCCKAKNCYPKNFYKAVKRQHNPNGCGVTLNRLDAYARSNWPNVFATANNWDKNVRWYQQPVPQGAYLNIPAEVTSLINANRLPKACAGGWIKASLHQLNTDGAGAYKCKLDTGATGNRWDGGWLRVTANIKWGKKTYNNVPGNAHSVNGLRLKNWTIVIHLPHNLNCRGSIGGQQNICLIRCENSAKNGPFGGCIPFQQSRGKVTQVQSTLVKIVQGDPVTVTNTVTETILATPSPEPTDVIAVQDDTPAPSDDDDGDNDESEYGNDNANNGYDD